MELLKITLAQINIAYEQPDCNLEKAEQILQAIPEGPNHIVLFPELWTTGFTPGLNLAARENEAILQNLSKIAKDKNLFIGGTYITKDSFENFHNTFSFITPSGKIIQYHKIHLFPQMNEVNWFTPGNSPVIFSNADLKIGLSTCYDLRFPELFRVYGINGVNLCLLPAQWPTKRIQHFNKLSTARAIENQYFFITTNTVGKIRNTQFGGSSGIYDPLGDPVLQCSSQEEDIQTTEIDLSQVNSVRNSFPVLSDKKISDSAQPLIIADF